MNFSRHNPLTLAGFIFLGVTAFVMLAAINSGTNLLFFTFGLLAAGLIISALFSWASIRKLTFKRILPDHAVAGEPLDIQYHLTNHKRRWPCFALHITESKSPRDITLLREAYCLHIPPKSSAHAPAQLMAARRGLFLLPAIRLACAFPFGFLNQFAILRHADELVVYPRIGMLNRRLAVQYRETIDSGAMTSSLRGGNDEFYGVREYRAGDNIRAIHWRSTARTGELMIKEMTSNAPPQMIVVVNLRNFKSLPDGRDQAERAIELAASLICYGFLENFAVGLSIAGLPNAPEPLPLMGRDNRARLLHQLAVLNLDKLITNPAPPITARFTGRPKWITVTLTASDPIADLLPPGAPQTTLSLDSPDSPTWLHFLPATHTLSLLREK